MTDIDPQKTLDRLLAREDLDDALAQVRTRCRRKWSPTDADDTKRRQDEIETGSQVVGADDEWA